MTHRERLTRLVMERCKVEILRTTKPGKRIKCGVQGCTFMGPRRGTVVKVTPIEHAPAVSRGGRERSADRDALRDVAGAAWIFSKHLHYLGPSPQQALPAIKHIGVLSDCLMGYESPRVPQRAYVTQREDLPNLPANWRRRARPAMQLLYDLEEDVVNGVHPMTWARKNRERIDRLKHGGNLVAWHIFDELFGLEKWLVARGAMLFDLHLDNLGIRRVGRRMQVVVRDTGCIVRRSQHDWSERRAKHWAGDLGGLDAL